MWVVVFFRGGEEERCGVWGKGGGGRGGKWVIGSDSRRFLPKITRKDDATSLKNG